MEALAARIAAFCLQKHYIEPDQIETLSAGKWFPGTDPGTR